MLRIRKTGTMAAAAALAAMALGAAVASAGPLATDTDDHYNPISTQVTGTSTSTVFAAGGVTVTCTHSIAGGKTPAKGLGAFKINPPVQFNDGSPTARCTDSLGFTDVTTVSGTWKLKFIDLPGESETATEPNSGDKLEVIIPIGGAVVSVMNANSLVCTITVAPTKAFKVIGTYDDVHTFTVAITNLPITVTGSSLFCPLSATKSTFNATYSFTPGFGDAS
jgi:hypothetical protein